MRVGLGRYDECYDKNSSFYLGGILFSIKSDSVPSNHKDILIYSIADALLGAAASGGISQSSVYSDREKNTPLELLQKVEKDIYYKGFKISNIDVTILTSFQNISENIAEMHANIISWLYLKAEQLNIKSVPVFNAHLLKNEFRIDITAIALLENRSK